MAFKNDFLILIVIIGSIIIIFYKIYPNDLFESLESFLYDYL